jgi:hypothetical protein
MFKKPNSAVVNWLFWIICNSALWFLLWHIEQKPSSPKISFIVLLIISITIPIYLQSRKPIPPSKDEELLHGMGYSEKSMTWGFGASDLSDLALLLFLGWISNPPYEYQARRRWWNLATTLGWVTALILGVFISLLITLLIYLKTEISSNLSWGVFGSLFGLLTGFVMYRLMVVSAGQD